VGACDTISVVVVQAESASAANMTTPDLKCVCATMTYLPKKSSLTRKTWFT
jgi:hypothetical protein